MATKRDGFMRRWESFFYAAVLGAHATAAGGTFRQRDVRFLFELFSNWTESSMFLREQVAQNTQILRFLSTLTEEGFIKRQSKGTRPSYRLTRLGLLHCVTELTGKRSDTRPEHFFFLYYFLSSYGERIISLVAAEGSQFSSALRLELQSLLDVSELLRLELQKVENEIRRYALRKEESNRAQDITRKLFRAGRSLSEVVKEVEKQYPFELSSQKRLSALLSGFPEEIGRWEMEVGNARRAKLLWSPTYELLRSYREQLKQLSSA